MPDPNNPNSYAGLGQLGNQTPSVQATQSRNALADLLRSLEFGGGGGDQGVAGFSDPVATSSDLAGISQGNARFMFPPTKAGPFVFLGGATHPIPDTSRQTKETNLAVGGSNFLRNLVTQRLAEAKRRRRRGELRGAVDEKARENAAEEQTLQQLGVQTGVLQLEAERARRERLFEQAIATGEIPDPGLQ